MANEVHNPEDPMQSANEDLALAASSAAGIALWGLFDPELLGGIAKPVIGGAKLAAKAGYGAAVGLGKAGIATAKNKTVQGVAARAVGGMLSGTAAVVGSVGGAAIGLGWGVGKATIGLGADIVRTGLRVGASNGGSAAIIGGAAVAGVAAAAFPSSYLRHRYPHERGTNVASLMQDMNASGDIVLGAHNSR